MFNGDVCHIFRYPYSPVDIVIRVSMLKMRIFSKFKVRSISCSSFRPLVYLLEYERRLNSNITIHSIPCRQLQHQHWPYQRGLI